MERGQVAVLKLPQNAFKMANNPLCFQSALNVDWTSCDATLTRKRVVAMHGGEKLIMLQDGHLLPYYPRGRKLKQKTFTVGGKHVARLCTSIFHHSASCHSCWQHLLVRCLGLARTVSEFNQWESWSDHWPGEPTNRKGAGHWPLPPSPPPRVELCCCISTVTIFI